ENQSGQQRRLDAFELSDQLPRLAEVEQVHAQPTCSSTSCSWWCGSSSHNALCAPAMWICPPILCTSTRAPYSSDSVDVFMTSSGLPIRHWPLTRYSTRSTNGSTGLISCVTKSTAVPEFRRRESISSLIARW